MAQSKRTGQVARGKRGGQVARGRLSPAWIVPLVLCGLVAYLVVRRADEVKEVKIAGNSITFRDNSSASALPREEQRERSRKIEQVVEQDVRETTATPVPSAVDLTDTWTMPDGGATWTVSLENGFYVFRERSAAAPDVVSAVGYGAFDGNNWNVQFQTILGASGEATLALEDERTLRGDAVVDGDRFAIELHR